MDPITAHVTRFLDLCHIEAEGLRKIFLEKVTSAFSEKELQRIRIYSQIVSGPYADTMNGICLAEHLNLFPSSDKVELITQDGPYEVPAYFKSLLEKDFSKQFSNDPEKAERMKELTFKNQFRSISKEATNLYLVTRFGSQHLDPIPKEPSKELIFETFTRLYKYNPTNESFLNLVKEVIQKLDPSNLSDVSWLVKFVTEAKNISDLKPEYSKFFKESFTHSKKYTLIERFQKWLIQYLPSFIRRAFNLLPVKDVKDLIEAIRPMSAGILGFKFPIAIPEKAGLIFELEPIEERIVNLDLSEFKELSQTELEYVASFKNLKGLYIHKDAKLPDGFEKIFEKTKINLLREEGKFTAF